MIQGLLSLSRKYDTRDIEVACDKAWRAHGFRYRIVKSLMERQSPTQQTLEFLDTHPVIRPLEEYDQFLKQAIRGE